jgi:hypothetical protein
MELTELAELSVGDHERAESAKTLQSLIAVLLSSLLVNWSTWNASICAVDLLCLPDEVLEEITLILAEKKDLGLFNDGAGILDQSFALGRKLVGRVGQGARCEEAVESNIDLFVLRDEKSAIEWIRRNRGAID